MDENLIKLDEKEISQEDLKKVREDLPNNQRIVEVKEGEYKTITRMQG